ncbi:HSP90-like protein [Citrus associated ampelovirus 1]|nr:HSP90-like protein [Citrus associated ampelovirus 1]
MLIEYESRLDDTLDYFYATKNRRKVFEDIIDVVSYALMNGDRTGGELSLQAGMLGTVRVQKADIRGITVETIQDKNTALAIIILEVCGATSNSIYSSGMCYNYYMNRHTVLTERKSSLDEPIDHGSDKYFNLTPTDRLSCADIMKYRGEIYSEFCVLVGCYLGRAVTYDDIGGIHRLPVVETTLSVVDNAQKLGKTIPKCIKTYCEDRLKYDRKINDKSVNSKYIPMRVFASDITKLLSKRIETVSNSSLYNQLLDLCHTNRPKIYDYERRYQWYLKVMHELSNSFKTYYDMSFRSDRKRIRSDMTLLDGDNLHDLESYFESNIQTKDLRTIEEKEADLLYKVEQTLLRYHDKIDSTELPIVYVISAYLIYFSIYSTCMKRVERHKRKFVVDFEGRIVIIKPLEAITYASMVSRTTNCIRLWARNYAALTFWLRKTNNLRTNVWNKFRDVPQYLCFDTVNFVPTEMLDLRENIAVSVISKWIKCNNNPRRGKFLFEFGDAK